jgi:platelet-activating factor acetylhydrolase
VPSISTSRECSLFLLILYRPTFAPSASLEFLRLVTPTTGSGKALIDRCMTDESILRTELIDEIPDDHRPDDEWIAARLRVDHEFRKRVAAGLQRKFKRNFQGGMGTGYTTSDEVWSHFKPTEEELDKWINEENRGAKRINEQAAMKGDAADITNVSGKQDLSKDASRHDNEVTSVSHADQGQRTDGLTQEKESHSDNSTLQDQQDTSSSTLQDEYHNGTEDHMPTNASVAAPTAGDASTSDAAPSHTWLGIVPALRDGPQQA